MFKKRWLKRLFILLLLVTTWNKDKIFRWFETPRPAGEVDIGVLVNDKMLSGNKEEDVKLAKSYLSQEYLWVYIPDKCDGKIPLPWAPFSEGTGFHFQPVSKKQQEVPQLMARR